MEIEQCIKNPIEKSYVKVIFVLSIVDSSDAMRRLCMTSSDQMDLLESSSRR